MTKKVTPKKKPAAKSKVQSRTIKKMFENNEFQKIATNTLSFSNKPDKELIEIWEDIFLSIQRANPNVNSFRHSIMLLLSSVAEIYYLHKDRETRQRQKQEMYDEWIESFILRIGEKQEYIGLAENNISLIKKEAKAKKKSLTPAQFRKINDYKMLVKEHVLDIIDLKQRIRSAKRSKELRMFEVTKNEKLAFDMTAQIANKNEKIIQLMKEFGINPNLSNVINPQQGGVNEIFKELVG